MSEPNQSASEPAPQPAANNAQTSLPPSVDLKQLLPPAEWSLEQLEKAAREIYFKDLVPNPPVTPEFKWLEKRSLIIAPTEGGFLKIFGKSEGWSQYQHRKTGELDPERLRRASWIRPVIEMRAPKTKIYKNNHSMKPREYDSRVAQESKRIFITLGKEVIYFISLVYTREGLALSTAFPPDGEWLRKMQANSTFLGP